MTVQFAKGGQKVGSVGAGGDEIPNLAFLLLDRSGIPRDLTSEGDFRLAMLKATPDGGCSPALGSGRNTEHTTPLNLWRSSVRKSY